MRALGFALLALRREWNSGELIVLVAALVVAVTALTGVGFFTDRIARAVSLQAGEVIAADLKLQAGERPSDDVIAAAEARGLASARTVTFPNVVFFGEESSLAFVRAVSAGYPLRGAVKIADIAFVDGRETNEIPASGEVWLDSGLLARLDAAVGDSVSIGAATFRIAHVLTYRPDQSSAVFEFAPTLLMNIDDIPGTELLQPGSRARYAVLFGGAPADVEAFRSELEATKQPGERLVDVEEASPQVQRSIERAGRFLNLSALMTVLLAAVAVAMAARRYVRRHLDAVALMKCMGASQSFVLSVIVVQLAVLALVAAGAGAVLGYLMQEGLSLLLRGLLRGDLPAPSAAPGLLGLATAVTILIGFALPPMLRLRRVPPARVLRRNLEPPPVRYAVNTLLALGALLTVLFWLVRDAELVVFVAVGTSVMLAVMFLAGFLLVRLAGRVRGGVGVAWRYGIANLSRRGAENAVQVVAFGVGLTVLLLLGVVRNDLLDEWQASLPADTPNHYLVNIRADQTGALSSFFAERGLNEPRLFPIVSGRLTAIEGERVAPADLPTERGRRFAEREQNLSWAEMLPEDNTIVDGRWWTEADRGRDLVSVSTEFAEELGVGVGDTLTFDVAGEAIDAEVASIRDVRWDNFRPNFFLVFPPDTLDGAIGTWLAALRLEGDERRALVDLVRERPNVSIVDLDAILVQVREMMDRASLAVQYVFLFSLAAGVIVLIAAVESTRDERRFESAMLRTLGASRRVVLGGIATEFTALGLLAGLLAAVGASAGGWLIATEFLDLTYRFDPAVWLIGLAVGALLVGGVGTLATSSVVNQAPLRTLRKG